MQFETDRDLTLDGSVQIHVRSNGDEYIYSFNCNMRELEDLENEVRIAKQLIVDDEDIRAMQKTKAFWKALKNGKDSMVDMQKLLKEYRAKKKK